MTGAGGALGRAVALEFARGGVKRIAGLDFSEKALAASSKALKDEVVDVDFLPVLVDISDEKQVEDAFGKVVNKFGRIDYAVNNAAIASPFVTTGESEVKDFDRIQKVNIRGTWLCEREELRQMIKQNPLPPAGGLS